jgi:hypothetical protein
MMGEEMMACRCRVTTGICGRFLGGHGSFDGLGLGGMSFEKWLVEDLCLHLLLGNKLRETLRISPVKHYPYQYIL